MKKIAVAAIATLLVAVGVFAFIKSKEKISVKLAGGPTENKIAVVATLFPQFDFARAIAGDCAQITLLMPPGMESHSFEPTPADITKIGNARVFLYTGNTMEPWAKRLTASLGKKKTLLVVDVSHGVGLSGEEHAHDHKHGLGEQRGDGGKATTAPDPHIWTDPNNAMIMARNITAALSAVDPKNEALYKENAKNYIAQLVSIDRDLKTAVASAKRREIVMGGRNAMYYFLKRYGITARSAFDSCSAGQEPSVKAIAELKDEIQNEGLEIIYYEELQEPRVARALAEGTEARLLLLHSLHNLTKEEFDAGNTYVSIMRQNLENLKEGLR